MAMPSACSGRRHLVEQDRGHRDREQRRQIAERPGNARAHAPVGLERQQRDGGGKQQADQDEDQRAARVPSLPVEHEGRKRRKQQRRGRNADRCPAVRRHVAQPELGQHQRDTEEKGGAQRQHLRVVEQVAGLRDRYPGRVCDPAKPKNR
jgi:hypothetical protein